jgi:hypothetical protein
MAVGILNITWHVPHSIICNPFGMYGHMNQADMSVLDPMDRSIIGTTNRFPST